ncbi:transcription elongation factor Spt5 [Methanocella arvoryzae]|uniref:Transcription elongation factor Spt5 n=1 Tax=Methanocella arvoryzae (strain DSM 22066 / NBRC 105507 / MRE50) TaxID=351160 RepID=Q0W048_METAR|nr:transcription elongation factor Spt5 [Methanocella arvoryzae]CAJ38245.1 50S ribosomal protein L26E [Methanocella arvoryzae MRE50]
MADEAAQQAIPKSAIFAVKTTANQERSVANLIAMVTRKENLDIRSVLVPEELKGYVLVESPMAEIVEDCIKNIPHAKAVVRGASSITEVQHFLAPKPTVTGISEGDIVELTAGPFKGEKARVKRIDEAKEEITVELSEAMVPIPVTVRGDIVRVLSKEETGAKK